LLIGRLKWDIHPLSWVSRTKIRKWRDKYAGQKAVILCNGPSLNMVDFDMLDKSGVFTFGLNKINLLFDRTTFRPSVIVAVNPFVMEQNAEFYNDTQIPVFLDSKGIRFVRHRRNIHFLHSSFGAGRFAQDCSMSICQGNTVTYVAMQLAFHLGFAQVALVGCDHSFATKGPAGKTVVSGQTDPNHFDPNYFAGGVKWQLPDFARSELYYSIARDIYENDKRKIVNCTDGGNLELFERRLLRDFLNVRNNSRNINNINCHAIVTV
jgi:hypothetical protein